MKLHEIHPDKLPARLLAMGKWRSDKCTALDLGVKPSTLTMAGRWLAARGLAAQRPVKREVGKMGNNGFEYHVI